MGEIAEMMLDGTLCECCGEFIDSDGAAGFPRYCSEDCAAGRGMRQKRNQPLRPRAFACTACPRSFRSSEALGQHTRDKHESSVITPTGE